MTEMEQDLARRLAAHRRWTWMAGMLCGDRRITSVESGEVWADDCYYAPTDAEWRNSPLTVPDLSDPATQGCLDSLLYEAGEGIVAVIRHAARSDVYRVYRAEPRDGWVSWRLDDSIEMSSTKGEALARALLDAWCEP